MPTVYWPYILQWVFANLRDLLNNITSVIIFFKDTIINKITMQVINKDILTLYYCQLLH